MTCSRCEWPADPELEWCPPGHGDIYTALAASGTLDALLGAGLRYAFVSNSDNLGALADVRIAAWLAAEQVPFALEAVRGTPADRKGGHLARYQGRVVLRETAQVPDGDTSFTDVERWRWYNTNNIWIDLRALKELQAADPAAPDLPLIVNRKTVDPRDPASTPVIQLESAMGAAIGSIPGARAIHVPRSRFAPVKTTDDLLVVRSDAYQLTSDGQMRPALRRPGAGRHAGQGLLQAAARLRAAVSGRAAVAAPLPPVRGRRRRHLRRRRRSRGRRTGSRSPSRSGQRGTRRMKLSNCHSGFLTGAPGPWKMANPVREYDWGSTRALAALQGREPSGRPEAELWMGAHPAASVTSAPAGGQRGQLGRRDPRQSGCRAGPGVHDPVRRTPAVPAEGAGRSTSPVDPGASVPSPGGRRVRPRTSGRHTAGRAQLRGPVRQAGNASASYRVRRTGRPAPTGPGYPDATSLDVPALRPVLLTLKSTAGQAGPAGVLAILATWPRAQRRALASSICERAYGLLDGTATSLDPDEQSSLEWVITLAEQHPDDPLVVAPLLLRLHRLQPGQPIYLPNGVPHAYLSGVGVEIMASSDNVVRGGLTSKRVDSQALADLLDPDAAPLLTVPRVTLSPHEVRWQPPVPDFALSRVVVSNVPVTLSREPSDPVGPEVLLCLNGEVTVSSDGGDVSLRGGQSAFVSASASPAVLAGTGQVYRATVGRAYPRR